MALDLGKFKKGVQKSAENLRQSVSEAAEKMPDSVKDIKMSDSVKDFAQRGQNAFTKLKTKGEESLAQQKEKRAFQKEAVSDALRLQSEQEVVLSIRDSLRIIYCLMIADGQVSDEETARVCEIGQELDPEFPSYQSVLIEEGAELMSTPSEDGEDYYDSIHDRISEIVHTSSVSKENGLRGKILLWDLITIAFSDGDYATNEKRLLRYIAKCLGVDYAILLEMEQTVRTLLAVEAEESWLKSSDRTYEIVKERTDELTGRKDSIMQGIRALLAD